MIYYSFILPLGPPPCLENTICAHIRKERAENKISRFWIDPAFSIQGGKLPGYELGLAAIMKAGLVFHPAFRSKGFPRIDAVGSEEYPWARSMQGLERRNQDSMEESFTSTPSRAWGQRRRSRSE
jgi:hypothetical protein